MKEHEWIAGILWDIVDFAEENQLTTIERAVARAIREIEPETGPDPREHGRSQPAVSCAPKTCGNYPTSAEIIELERGKSRREQ